MNKWTTAQQRAIDLRDKDILVAAAAGSGKTAVLIERILQRILEKENPISVLNLLVVTFTNAAAAEMRSRLARGLTQKIKEEQDPKKRHLLETQLILLSGASISTLHGFCQDLIRQYIHKIGWNPDFRLLNETEAALLKEDLLDQLLEEVYQENNPTFLELADTYSSQSDDRILRGLILSLHTLSMSHPLPDQWLLGLAENFSTEETDFSQTSWGKVLLSHAALTLEGLEQTLFHLVEEMNRRGRSYGETFSNDQVSLEGLRLGLAQGWDGLADALGVIEFQRASWGVSTKAPEQEQEDKKFFEKQRNKIKEQVARLHRYFARTSKELFEELAKSGPQIEMLVQLTLRFTEYYQQAKIQEGFADFSDLEHGALSLLRNEENPSQPSEVAFELQEKYKEVMVDEYQDTNGVQESIISFLCDPDGAYRFQVGDVKQSIYKFRLAEPELFLSKYLFYPESAETELINLNQNFRSRNEILWGINFICTQLFSKASAEMEYGEAESLKPGANYPEWNDTTLAGPIELHLLEKPSDEQEEIDESGFIEDTDFRKEAHLTAQIIQKWHQEKKQVFDKKTNLYRDFQWRDAVILLRSVKGRTPDLLEIFRSYEIPCHADLDEGYFQETEVQTLLSTLAVIDNPYQDIHLAAVLRSPIGDFKEPELAQIRLVKTHGSYWEALKEARTNENLAEKTRTKIEIFLAFYDTWRSLSRRESVPHLIQKILGDTLYDSWVTALSGGALRAANVKALQERAQDFETSGMRGLSRFLRFIEKLREKGSDWGPARILGEGENVVRLLSIHKSKGLEFPAVFLLNLGKKFNQQDTAAPILFHKSLGAGPYLTDLELRYRYPTGVRLGIQKAIEKENKAEELRVLYVALTRAEEKLVLIGSSSSLRDQIAQTALEALYYPENTLPAHFVLSSRSYLEWLLLGLVRHKSMQPILQKVKAPQTGEIIEDDSVWEISLHDRVENIQDQSRKEFLERSYIENLQPIPIKPVTPIESLLHWQYSHEEAVGKPGKTSVTELKRRLEWMEREDTLPELETKNSPKTVTERPRFIQENSELTPAEKGTQLHSLMQHLDFSEADELDKVAHQVTHLIEKGLLPTHGTDSLPLLSITKLIKSDFGQRLLAGNLKRELPFSGLIPAEKLLNDWDGITDPILIQGVVDLLMEEPDGFVLLDYKSDHLKNSDQFKDRYFHQMNLYYEALNPILPKPIKEIWIYSFHLNQAIQLK